MDLAFNIFLLNSIPTEILPVIDIFKHKNINNAVTFDCNTHETAITVQKLFFNNQIRLTNIKSDYNASYKIPISYPRLGMVLNTSCDDWMLAFDRINSKYLFKSQFNWLIITEDVSSTANVLTDLPIELDSDVILIHKSGKKLYNLYEAYNTGIYTHGLFKLNKIGYWDSTLHLEKRNRMDLSGVVLKCTVVITQKVVGETFEEYTERSKLSKSDTLHKLKYFTLLKYLRDMYNISYALRRTNSWGYEHNGSFDGMIGTLQRREADIGCSPCFFRSERAKVVDSTIEVWPSRPVFIMRHPKHPSGYSTIFTRPLTAKVWCCILALLVTSALALCTMCSLRQLRHDGDDADSSHSLVVLTIWSAICQQGGFCLDFDLLDWFLTRPLIAKVWCCILALLVTSALALCTMCSLRQLQHCQQGSAITRDSTSIKLVIFVTFLFTLTIYQYYNATVVSTLLREPPKNIRTPRDLLRSSLRAGVHDVLYNKDFFKHTTDPIALEMYNKKIVTATEQNFYSLEYGMELVKRGGFAFLVDSSIAYGIMRDTFDEIELCDAHEVALYPPQNMVAVVQMGSPYREHFAYGLRKMFESGVMRRIRSSWDETRPPCVRTPDNSLVAVSVREFSTALVVLACGFMAATAALLWEIASFKTARN